MRGTFIFLSGIGFFGIGYLYPFIVVFRGGTLMRVIGLVWWLSIAYVIVLCLGLPKFVAFFDPVFAVEMNANWVPDTPAIVPVVALGWTAPLAGGAAGRVVRRMALALFPDWMHNIPPNHA